MKTFVKTKSGKEKFYKDGYTDLRGRFDYASVNSASDLKEISRFSIFVMHNKYGSLIREAGRPTTVGRVNTGVLKSKKY